MTTSLSQAIRSRTAAVFLFFWAAFGATTNVHNLRAYTLQQMGVDAIVAHHTFALGRSALPVLKPMGDAFFYRGNILAAKQPGQFVFGAIPYFFLHALGITYERNYDLASALVTWLSAGIFAAAAMALLDRMLRRLWGFGSLAALLATLAVGLGSNWFCYAGVAHHDILAGSLIVGSLYAIEYNRQQYAGRDLRLSLAAGALLGLAVFTSMLPALIVAAVGVYVLATLPIMSTGLWHGAGFLLGLLPLFAYNAWYFGSPLVPANVAGNYSDTFLSLQSSLAASHLDAYLGMGGLSIWKYAPALVVGIAGLFLLPRRLKYFLGGALLVHLFYLIHIPTLGGCEYGPRYLLPLLPLLAIGVAPLVKSRGGLAALGALIVYGFLVNLVGALHGTMDCNTEEFALWQQIAGPLAPAQFPLLALALLLPVAAVGIWQSSDFSLPEPVKVAPEAAVPRRTRKRR